MNFCCHVESFNFHASTGSKRIQLKGCYRISRSYFQISSFKFNTKYMYLRFLVLWRSQWCDQISSFNVGQKDPTTKCIFFSYRPTIHLLSLYLIKQMLNFRDLIILCFSPGWSGYLIIRIDLNFPKIAIK